MYRLRRPVTHCVRGMSLSAEWRVRLYFGSHVNRLELTHCLRDTHVSENACLLEIEKTPIFQATRKRVGAFPGKI